MNWLEREVPSLELCKKLKEVGYPQDTDGYLWVNAKKVWVCGEECWAITEEFYLANEKPYYPLGGIPQTDWAKKQRDDWYSRLQWYKAPTCREVGEWLPVSILINGEDAFLDLDHPSPEIWIISYMTYDKGFERSIVAFDDKSEISARVKMFIWLKQHGYIDFKKEA